MLLLLQVSLLSHVLLPLYVMQHLFQVVVARVVIDAMVHMLLHVTADTLVHMLLHSVGVLDACATAILWMWLLHVLLLVMVPLLLLLCV